MEALDDNKTLNVSGSPNVITTTTSISSKAAVKSSPGTPTPSSPMDMPARTRQARQSYVKGAGENSTRVSTISIDSERVERIAQLIQQHKERHFDATTGKSDIPGRAQSMFGAPAGFDIVMQKRNSMPNYAEFRTETGLDSIMTSESEETEDVNASSSKLKPLDKITNYVRRSSESLLSATNKLNMASSNSSFNLKDFPTTGKTTEPLAIEDSDSLEKTKSISLKTNQSLKLTDYDPLQLGKDLFAGTVPNFTKSGISPIIGKGGDFYNTVLMSYMNCFEFFSLPLDDAFRYLFVTLDTCANTCSLQARHRWLIGYFISSAAGIGIATLHINRLLKA
jgi:hypothetical protein